MPSPLSTVQDRLPEVLERAEVTLQTLREIVGRIPASLDRSDQFFTNVERIVRESQLPELSADSRKFFATTSTQIEQITTNLDRLVGTQGTLVKFADDARAAIKRVRPASDDPFAREARWNIPAWRPTISGVRCQPSGTRSSSCASSRACWKSSRSRLSTAHDRRQVNPR